MATGDALGSAVGQSLDAAAPGASSRARHTALAFSHAFLEGLWCFICFLRRFHIYVYRKTDVLITNLCILSASLRKIAFKLQLYRDLVTSDAGSDHTL